MTFCIVAKKTALTWHQKVPVSSPLTKDLKLFMSWRILFACRSLISLPTASTSLVARVCAEHATSPGLSLNTPSKAAIAGLPQALARELGSRAMTLSAVHPESTNTDRNPAGGRLP